MTDVADRSYSGIPLSPSSIGAATVNSHRGHTLLSFVFLFGAASALFFASDFRFLETQVAANTFELAGLGQTEYLGGDKLYAHDLGVPVRFTVTQQCGVMLLIAPLMLAAAIVLRSRHVTGLRVLLAVSSSFLTLLAANQVRLALIGWTIKVFGFNQGFPLGHLVLGTFLSIFAVVGSIALFARALGTSRIQRPKRQIH